MQLNIWVWAFAICVQWGQPGMRDCFWGLKRDVYQTFQLINQLQYRRMDRRSWTIEEDLAIRKLVQQFGVLDWTNISQKLKQRYEIKQRTGKQCRQRWYNHLNPQVNKKPWTGEEQNMLFQIHRKSGNKWKLMSKHFEGRTDNDIKNHFYSTLRRSLRRLNKFIGEKNSTTQMREIKPSVLSTIMNYIYEQESSIESNIVNSLKDLPYLIFEFSNYKPVKSRLKIEDDEDIKGKINFIFSLINSANNTYQNLKLANRNMKAKKSQHLVVTSHEDDEIKKQKAEEIDFIKYLPKKSYTSSSQLEMQPMSAQKKSPKQKPQKSYKRAQYCQIKAEHSPGYEKDILHTDIIQDNGMQHNPQYLIKKQQQQRDYYYHQTHPVQKREDYQLMEELGQLRERRISLEAHEEFMEQEIGDIDQPSQVSGFYYSGMAAMGLEELVVVGKQVVIHSGDMNPQHEVKVEHLSSHQNIDELIQINYSN